MRNRVLLTLAALLPYWRLLTLSVVFVTDDYFASDIYNGELPGRVLVGRALRSGQLPAWTSQICSGYPLAGAPSDPIGLALFTLFPPAPALDLLIVVLLLVAAHGTYSLARRLGADATGALLAGIAFAGSGYIACQLKHLSIVSTVVWLPVGMLLVDRALGPRASRLALPLLGLVFAQQVLSGFPQSAYISALTYGAFALYLVWPAGSGLPTGASEPRRWESGWMLNAARRLGGVAVAGALGGAAGAVVLLPLSAIGSISDRAEAQTYEWSTRLAYWLPNLKTFLMPYANGDISDNSYVGPPFFWEDYGYVGALTFVLALYAAFVERRRRVVAFTFALTLVAYFFVLGQATPVFRVAYLLIPGLSLFRFPTRFLIVVELGLALLAAFGLTRLRADLARRWPSRPRVPAIVVSALCALTALDLFVHQPRQNPMVPAAQWLAPPSSVQLVSSGTARPRTFTPRHRDLHRRAFLAAHGWADVAPYYELRDVLAPNLGGAFWNVTSADCYVGVSPRWFIDVWGDHNRELSLMWLLTANNFDNGRLGVKPNLPPLLAAYGVTHVLSSFPVEGAQMPFEGRAGAAYVYRVDGAARVRLVTAARHVTDADAAKRLLDPSFDPRREVLLADAPPSAGPAVDANAAMPPDTAGRAAIVRETPDEVLVEASSPADAWLLLADTFYPGWTAEIDGRPAPMYRANLSVRAVPFPEGSHAVRFRYDPPGLQRGLAISAGALLALLAWLGVSLVRSGPSGIVNAASV